MYTASRDDGTQEPRVGRQRLLSEQEAPALESSACSVEDVLRLLQLLYAISRDGNIENNTQGKYKTYQMQREKRITQCLVYSTVLSSQNLNRLRVNNLYLQNELVKR